MVNYSVSIDEKTGILNVYSEAIQEGSIPINIPNNDKKKKLYISLFLHKADIEEGLDFLMCISRDKNNKINHALFLGALTNIIKCFQSTKVCPMLNESKFRKFAPDVYTDYERFKSWRNKHFVHDENCMREAIAFLLIAPEGSSNVFGGPPSVVWNKVPVDYVIEGRNLERVMQALWRFVCDEIDKTAKEIVDSYSGCSREELLSYEIASMRKATTDSPAMVRTIL